MQVTGPARFLRGPKPFLTPTLWAATTPYVISPEPSAVTYQGVLYVCTTAHTSGSTFDPTKWLALAFSNAVLTTSGAPANTTGNNGDYAYDPTTQIIYGPKAAGVWPAGTYLRGNAVRTTSGVPASGFGIDGDFAYDPVAAVMYGPKAGGAWPAGVSFATLVQYAALLALFPKLTPPGFAHAFLDQYGVASAGILDDGTFRAAKAQIDALSAVSLSVAALQVGADTLGTTTPAGWLWALLDSFGVSAGGWLADGTFVAGAAQLTSINSIPVKRLSTRHKSLGGSYLTEIRGFISYGQSQSLGNVAYGDIQKGYSIWAPDSLRFNANGVVGVGPRAQEGSGTVAQNHASLVPFAEEANLTSGNGETPLGNGVAMLKKLLVQENDLLWTAQSFQALCSAPGQSNTAISGLNKGTTPYANLIADVTYGAALAAAAGKTYSCLSVWWFQGSRDNGDGTTRAAYLAAFLQLYTDLNTDIKAATGQTDDIKLLTLQATENGFSSGTPSDAQVQVSLAQRDAALANANIILVSPYYQAENYAAGNIHLDSYGSALMGAFFGLVDKRVTIDGGTWKPLQPNRIWRPNPTSAPTILLARFDVPQLPLKIDTAAYVTAVANAGFTAINGSGTAVAITSVTLISPDTVKIVLATGTAGKLRYGFANRGGNLRDSQGDVLDAGLSKSSIRFDNVCVAFEEAFL